MIMKQVAQNKEIWLVHGSATITTYHNYDVLFLCIGLSEKKNVINNLIAGATEESWSHAHSAMTQSWSKIGKVSL